MSENKTCDEHTDRLQEHEYKMLRLDEEYLRRALACAPLLPPPGDEELEKVANSHLLVLDELTRAVEVLVKYGGFLNKLRDWTLELGSELCPPSYCADTYGDGVREMKEAVRRMLMEVDVRRTRMLCEHLADTVDPADGKPVCSKCNEASDTGMRTAPASGGDDFIKNMKWIRAHEQELRGRWVALLDGLLVDTDFSRKALQERLNGLERMREILVLRVSER